MPDLPPSKRAVRIPRSENRPAVRSTIPYAELHCRTNFSFLRGASHPDELALRAAELGYTALAITDRNSVAGVVRTHTAAKELGLKLLIGAEIVLTDASPVLLWAADRAAYARLTRLITTGSRRAPKGECHLTFDDLAEHAEGLLAGVLLTEVVNEPEQAAWLDEYRAVFGDRCYGVAELHCGPDDEWLLEQMAQRARQARIPLIAANDVHYHDAERRYLQDVLTAIRLGSTVADLEEHTFANGERCLKSPAQMRALFRNYPEAIRRTHEIAARCTFSLEELRYEYPEELCPAGQTPIEHLSRLTWAGARERYPRGTPAKVRKLIEHELKLIEELRYEAYFLTVWDLVRFARGRGILCQGRGSAANSVVCYCLGVTSVDPERIDVLFERFISKERNEAPDIDVDFEHERREEVIQYVYEKYGRERAGMTAEVITYRQRSAVRDVGKALGLSLDRVDRLAKSLDPYGDQEKIVERFREAGLDAASRTARQLLYLVREILGFPRHLSQHVGGLVITRSPLCELVPITNASMPGRTVIEWDKDDLDELGILKVDCLALGMLTAIRKCFELVERHWGRKLTLADVPAEDREVYRMVSRADTIGVFQIESRAQMAMLPRLRPRKFYDLVIEVAIVRPGPIQGDMVHPYLRRRSGDEPVEYPDDRIREVLEKTLGVPIFQEQCMRLAVVAAGFTPGEADQLRRAMAAWRRPGVIDQFREKLVQGMQAHGYSEKFAEQVFKQIRGFGEYGFPESHAASFALLVYVSSWLKRYYPAAFTAALLNSQPMGFYAPAQLVSDVRNHGIEVRPVDINFSEWDCTLEEAENPESRIQNPEDAIHKATGSGGACSASARAAGVGSPGKGEIQSGSLSPSEFCLLNSGFSPSQHSPLSTFALRLGLRMVKGLSHAHAARLVECRSAGPFQSFDDFARRSGLSSAVLQRLSQADVFHSLDLNRRSALWNAYPEQESLPLFDSHEMTEPAAVLPAEAPQDEVRTDYRSVGLSLRNHPMAFVRPQLKAMKIAAAADLLILPNDGRCKVAGLVLLRQRPGSARGVTFVTLEDETGTANLLIRQDVWERFHQAARTASAMLVRGQLQRQHGAILVLVDKIEDLTHALPDLQVKSRDFH